MTFNRPAYDRERRAILRSLGICINCKTRDAVPGTGVCGSCAEKRAEWQAQRKARWAVLGLCTRCGRERDCARKMCASCREYQRLANHVHQAKVAA